MKKMMILACLIFGVTAITAVAADLASIQGTSDSDMVTQLSNMDADGWVDYLNTALNDGDDALAKKVIINAQTALNSLDDQAARTVAEAINKDVANVAVARRLTGKYTLAYVGAVDSDGKIVTTKSIIAIGDSVGESDLVDGDSSATKINQLGKGGIYVSSSEEDEPYIPPTPPSKSSTRY